MRKLLVAIIFAHVAANSHAATLAEKLGAKRVDSIIEKVLLKQVKLEEKKLHREIKRGDDFLHAVRPRVLSTKAPEKQDAATWLEKGFGRFVHNYVGFLAEQTSEKQLVLSAGKLSSFLETQRAHCGELPCSVPPCCGDECDPC